MPNNTTPSDAAPRGGPMPGANPGRTDFSPMLARVPDGLFFLLVALTLFAPVLGGKRFPYGTDTVAHDYVMHLWGWVHVVLARGEWPLWCPHLFSGLPFLGSYALCPLFPSAWLYWVVPMPVGFGLQYALAVALAGWGMGALARSLGCSRLVGLWAGLAMMGSGHFLTLVHAGHLQKMMALALAPWALMGALGLARMGPRRTAGGGAMARILGRPGAWLLLSGSLALQMLASHPQIFYGTLALAALVVFPWVHVRPRRLGRRPLWVGLACSAAVVRVGGAGLMALALSAAQTFPGIEMGTVSNRAGGVSFEEATATSYPPVELLEYVVPGVFGSSAQGAPVGYHGFWGERIVSDFLGLGIWALAGAGFVALRRGSLGGIRHAKRLALLLAVAIVVSLVVGMGRHLPVYVVLWAILPGFSSFRSPGTFMFVANLCLLTLAAVGLEALLRRRGGLERFAAGRWKWVALGAVVTGLLAFVVSIYENLGVRLDLATVAEARRWNGFYGLGIFGVQLAVAAGVWLAVMGGGRKPSATGAVMWAFAVACLGLLFYKNSLYVRFDPLAPFQAYLNQETWRSASRPGTPHAPGSGEWPRILEENDLVVGALSVEAGTPGGYHPVVLARYEALRRLVPQQSPDFGALFAVNYARTRNEAGTEWTGSGFERVARQSAPAPAFLWRRTKPHPPVRNPVNVRVATDYLEAAALLRPSGAGGAQDAPGGPGSRAVVVVDDLEMVPSLQEGPQLDIGPRLNWDGPHRGRIQLAARPSQPVVLPMALPYAPGWKAQDLSGRPLPLIPVDAAATAVVLPPGATGATLRYAPYSFHLGLFVSLVALSVIAFFSLRGGLIAGNGAVDSARNRNAA